ncbi:site-specific integrase [Sulfitobacter sp. SK012]|uniref:site-specific integrase n=1 Tax=Sulfitobacter sp. SK012 TaxID=1389005 RepID=UPI0013B4266D|nr:site-specific integrase [Sulfitobacter sp. SK012]
MAGLRQHEMREMVRKFFQSVLEKNVDRVNERGLTPMQITAFQNGIDIHDEGVDGDTELSDQMINVVGFRNSADLTDDQWADNEAFLLREMRKADRDHLRAVLAHVKALDSYQFGSEVQTTGHASAVNNSTTLGDAFQDYLAEQERAKTWRGKTAEKNGRALDHLIEIFGADRVLASISQKDAQEAKKLMMELPSRRKTLPATRDLSLRDATKVDGLNKISVETLNWYLQAFAAFFGWAKKNGYINEKLFEGMKVGRAKATKEERLPFTPDAMNLMFKELTENPSGLVKSDSHKWGTLIGMFTGARLNEVAQLLIDDIKEEDGIWYFDISDEGENQKEVKNKASKRKVPVHSALLDAGFLAFFRSRQSGSQLFPDYRYTKSNGYGRNLGRWFNESFTPKLGIKTPRHVFHSFRHTMITRLIQAEAPPEKAKCIVGHEQAGVTFQVYMRERDRMAHLLTRLSFS